MTARLTSLMDCSTYVPGKLINQVTQGRINCTELYLVLMIQRASEKYPEGCYLPNHILGEMLHLTGRQIRRMVAHLKEQGVITESGTILINGRNHRVLCVNPNIMVDEDIQ